MKRIFSRFLALVLCLSLCPSGLALAAPEAESMTLVYSQDAEGSVNLSITGVEPDRVIHGVELEVTLEGSYQPEDIQLQPSDSSAFSPTFSTLAEQTDTATTVTLYLVSAYALNPQEELPLGALTWKGLGIAPNSARLALIDQNMIENGGEPQLSAVSLEPAPGTEAWGPSHSIKTAVTGGNGTVTAPPTARENQTVTLQAVPESGYEVESVLVNGQPAISLGDGQYTFRMPGEDVSIRVGFEEEKAKMNFSDVKEGAWYYSAVEYAYQRGIMSGVGEGKFSPNGNTSRGMIATILYQLEGKPAVTGESPFSDVKDGQWYTNAVKWANQSGLVAGYEDGTYRPNKGITRQELALILMRYAEYKGYDTSASGNLDAFTDSGKISSFARHAMSWAVGSGIIGGNEWAELNPRGGAQRAQAAVIFRAFLQNK